LAAGSTVPTGHVGSNDAPAGGPSAGVSKLIAGTGVTLTPPTGTGNVKVDAGVDAVARASAAAATAAAAAAQTTANGAQTTATGAASAAATAQTTADGAQTDADNAQATADSAQTDATNALNAANSVGLAADPVIQLFRYYSASLPDADATIGVNLGVVRYNSGLGVTPSAPRTYTLDPTGALKRSEIVLLRTSGVNVTLTIVNGGPGGGTLLTWVDSFTWQKAIFLFDDVSGDWFLDRQSILNP